MSSSRMRRDADALGIRHGVDQLPPAQMHVLEIKLPRDLCAHAVTQYVSTVGVRFRALENEHVILAGKGLIVGLSVEQPMFCEYDAIDAVVAPQFAEPFHIGLDTR